MAMELDPVFVRALRLLHSKSKDSGTQLRTMLEEAIRHRKGLGPGPAGAPVSPQQPPPKKESRSQADKRNLDKLKHDLSELVPDQKRSRLDSPHSSAGFSSKSHTPSPTPPGSRGEVADKHHSSGSGGNSSETEDASGQPMEMDLQMEGLNDCSCCVCKSLRQDVGNILMECHTCQNLYHQECHSPAVPVEEAEDPRLVWNCSNCRKESTVKAHTGKVTGGLNVLKGSSSSAARMSPSKSDLSYKKPDSKSSGSKVGSGMAGLAASYKSGSGSSSKSSSSRSSRSGSSSKSSSSSSSSKSGSGGGGGSSGSSSGSSNTSSSSSNLLSADRRIQMMKKKAAQRKMK